jgi:hypothetical protein
MCLRMRSSSGMLGLAFMASVCSSGNAAPPVSVPPTRPGSPFTVFC